MQRNLVTSLLAHERIITTEARAKAVRSDVDRLIRLARRGDLAARRRAYAYLLDKDVVRKLFDAIGPRYADRSSGYTRIIRLGPRRGDAAPMAVLELV
ncbi:MAG: 50S ribosomal protein L17 [Clostridia bacterium]|nr:50S ribosomal protein L17 [Clostridia bacterium]